MGDEADGSAGGKKRSKLVPPPVDTSGHGGGGTGPRGRSAPEAAFDLWLQRGLHALYDEVANEPVPEELLRLIQQDRDK